ncbi:MAG: methylmalonyl-CoA mutase [Dehalococcoidia bacterium]|nr:methylmalonyl-CoA mutase [Dehalococcoidia bacterium]
MPSKSKREWREKTYQPGVARFPEREKQFETTSAIAVDPVYDASDLAGWDSEQKLGYPGEYPFTRGIQPSVYRGRLWTMRQYAGFASAEESNKRYRYLLGQGQTGLSVAFDLPTQIGYDSDDKLARGEVGKVGVPICHLDDMAILFDQIPLDKVSTSMTINSTAPILLALYIAVGKRQGVPPEKLDGTVQNDILKEYIARGTYIYPPRPSLRLITDSFAYCAQHVPRWNTISISGYHIREAGATAAQELAFTLADGIAYVQAAVDAGLAVDGFAPNLSFFFAAYSNLFEEVAKFRAARRIWARIMKERFGAENPRSWMLRFHTQTGGATLTAQQPDNNIARTTIQALSAILGGTQSLHTNSKDEALALPSEQAVQVALRTQQILAYEAGVADVVDPLGGSYFVERLTDEMEAKVQVYLDRIDALGGALAAIEQGYMQREIQESAYQHQRAVDAGQKVVVGVNKFTTEERLPEGLLRIDAAQAKRQVERLARFRAQRDQGQARDAIKRLEEAAAGVDNTMPHILAAVEARATLGEIADGLRRVFGEQKESLVF